MTRALNDNYTQSLIKKTVRGFMSIPRAIKIIYLPPLLADGAVNYFAPADLHFREGIETGIETSSSLLPAAPLWGTLLPTPSAPQKRWDGVRRAVQSSPTCVRGS